MNSARLLRLVGQSVAAPGAAAIASATTMGQPASGQLSRLAFIQRNSGVWNQRCTPVVGRMSTRASTHKHNTNQVDSLKVVASPERSDGVVAQISGRIRTTGGAESPDRHFFLRVENTGMYGFSVAKAMAEAVMERNAEFVTSGALPAFASPTTIASNVETEVIPLVNHCTKQYWKHLQSQ
ncbi:hypothetical protein CAOG_06839 [Capsaspora owczarzaki ATCC 30864]|uniref:Uncharacterized protein n=1 Tax=Capsaspora owczarzaki (strain ATCC 30864) TaxID=595528 RepID=A0A0D2WUZ0_CAPO3|nr:hypothetical protein CAOG_06839 [Capsaspora owczarzaki ATCC 30864]KJE96530.1 hypothetical protein CAOG_006839 [Capsaspora owczarzaki ATCC 30864]|eukprot:XP_004344460.1 hypothetical protein CAOG_06839 [Capsaspora owczarzaki ATCC 30864]